MGLFIPSWGYRYLQHFMLHPYLWAAFATIDRLNLLEESGRHGDPFSPETDLPYR